MVTMKHAYLVLFSAILLALPVTAQVKVTPSGGKVSVEIDGKPFTDFYMSGDAFHAKVTKPYLWPLRAASGTYITRACSCCLAGVRYAFPVPWRQGRGLLRIPLLTH